MEAASRREFLTAGAAVPLARASTERRTPVNAPYAGLLAGKNAVIYGAAGSIGSTVARAFAAEGAHVFLAGRTFEKVERLAREITSTGGAATPARVDALARDAVENHLADVARNHGAIHISFNLIGIDGMQGDPLTAMNADSFTLPIENAMRTHYLTATAAARHMATHRNGVILALTAQVARKPYTGSGGFGVACAAIEGLCRQLAIELGPQGTRVITLRSSGSPDAPGVSAAIAEHARMAGVSREVFEARIAEKTMLRRMPRMAEIANAAVLMASERASAVTAAVTNVTCGEIAD